MCSVSVYISTSHLSPSCQEKGTKETEGRLQSGRRGDRKTRWPTSPRTPQAGMAAVQRISLPSQARMSAAKRPAGRGLRFLAFLASRLAAPWFWPIGCGHRRRVSPPGSALKHLLTQRSTRSFPSAVTLEPQMEGPGSRRHCVVGSHWTAVELEFLLC